MNNANLFAMQNFSSQILNNKIEFRNLYSIFSWDMIRTKEIVNVLNEIRFHVNAFNDLSHNTV